ATRHLYGLAGMEIPNDRFLFLSPGSDALPIGTNCNLSRLERSGKRVNDLPRGNFSDLYLGSACPFFKRDRDDPLTITTEYGRDRKVAEGGLVLFLVQVEKNRLKTIPFNRHYQQGSIRAENGAGLREKV